MPICAGKVRAAAPKHGCPTSARLQWAPGPRHPMGSRCWTREGLLPFLTMKFHLEAAERTTTNSHSFIHGYSLSVYLGRAIGAGNSSVNKAGMAVPPWSFRV